MIWYWLATDALPSQRNPQPFKFRNHQLLLNPVVNSRCWIKKESSITYKIRRKCVSSIIADVKCSPTFCFSNYNSNEKSISIILFECVQMAVQLCSAKREIIKRLWQILLAQNHYFIPSNWCRIIITYNYFEKANYLFICDKEPEKTFVVFRLLISPFSHRIVHRFV